MAKNLVIVESPAKVKTIKKYLGSDYEVLASQGHVRDLPKSSLGIDVDNDFEPKYIAIRGKGSLINSLRKAAKNADKIYLATDPDREGEAISWHLYETLKLQDKKVYRITFNEITKTAIKNSLKNPREIDMNLVNAQQTRRILDRLVGYTISPLLWAKVKRGLSAGRVQSVAVRIICDRENEINDFIPEEYWNLDVDLSVKGSKKTITAAYYGKNHKKCELKSKKDVDEVLKGIDGKKYIVTDTKVTSRLKNPPLPFTTSTLQQEASKTLGFAPSKTMRIAQQLYEGVDIKGRGTVALISYLRTDSTRISDDAKAMAATYIANTFGKDYLSGGSTAQKSGKIQDAHEAIRPTDVNNTPESLASLLARDQFRLYQLIWKRFVASQMAKAKSETVAITVTAGDYDFKASASKVIFEGYRCIYVSSDEEKLEKNTILSKIEKDDELKFEGYNSEQHFTQAPPHYTEASLIKTLEELGIGRPSTYAPTITTIMARRYIVKENKNLYVSEMGQVVNNIMVEEFPSIVDVNFTVYMEALLDKIEEGTVEYKTVVSNFYPDLAEAVDAAKKKLDRVKVADEVSDEICDKCGRNMVIKYGPHGKFLACPGFPECKNTKPFVEKINIKCPKCGKELAIRRTKKGRVFYGCEGYPECEYTLWQKPINKNCPKCGDLLISKGAKYVCASPECDYSETKKSKQSAN